MTRRRFLREIMSPCTTVSRVVSDREELDDAGEFIRQQKGQYNEEETDGLADGSGTARVEIDGNKTDESFYHIEAENGYLKMLYTGLDGEERALIVTVDGQEWYNYRTMLYVSNAFSETAE